MRAGSRRLYFLNTFSLRCFAMIEEMLHSKPFDVPECDTAFQARNANRRFLIRCGLLFSGVFIAITYALLDAILDASVEKLLLFRFTTMAALLSFTAISYVKGWFKGREYLGLISFLGLTGMSILCMATILSVPMGKLYLSGMITAGFAVWIFFLPSFRATLLASAALMLALLITVALSDLSPTETYTNLYFGSMSCITLIVGMLYLDHAERSDASHRSDLQETIDTLLESERRAVELYREAKMAEKAKDEFLAVVSHELRTPMNAIIGFSELISTEMLGKIEPPQYRDYAFYIRDSGHQLLSLINDILDVSRAQIDKMSFDMRDFDIASTVDSAILACTANAEAADIQVVRHVPVLHDLMFKGDESRLLQAMTNIIGNAIKFSDKGGAVTVDLAFSSDGTLSFKATDSGIGIAPNDLKHVKKPFKQAESAFVRSNGGLGLGLAICNIVAKAHEGTLDIESTLGEGTTVSMVLPAARVLSAAPPMAAPPQAQVSSGLGNRASA